MLQGFAFTSPPLGKPMDLLTDGCLERKTTIYAFEIVVCKCCTSVTHCSGVSLVRKHFHWAVILSVFWEVLTFDMRDIAALGKSWLQSHVCYDFPSGPVFLKRLAPHAAVLTLFLQQAESAHSAARRGVLPVLQTVFAS